MDTLSLSPSSYSQTATSSPFTPTYQSRELGWTEVSHSASSQLAARVSLTSSDRSIFRTIYIFFKIIIQRFCALFYSLKPQDLIQQKNGRCLVEIGKLYNSWVLGKAVQLLPLTAKIDRDMVDTFLDTLFDELKKKQIQKIDLPFSAISCAKKAIFADKYVVGETGENFLSYFTTQARTAGFSIGLSFDGSELVIGDDPCSQAMGLAEFMAGNSMDNFDFDLPEVLARNPDPQSTMFFLSLNQALQASKMKANVVRYVQKNKIPKGLQWNENGGYCGELSLMSAGLYYGQYTSQFDVRSIVNRAGSQQTEVLVGTPPQLNADKAAKELSLAYTLSNDANPNVNSHPHKFLAWVKAQVLHGYPKGGRPVAIGVYQNRSWFQLKGETRNGGYDHIVLVTGIGSNHPLTDLVYHDDDIIYFWDFGLWTGQTNLNGYTSSTFKDFQRNRNQANADIPNGNVYSLPDDTDNYGMAIQGVVDPTKKTIPLRVDALPLATNKPFREWPEIGDGSGRCPSHPQIDLQITASDLSSNPSVQYNIYRYDDPKQVPTQNFNANSRGRKKWQITSQNPIIQDSIARDLQSPPKIPPMAIYRAVLATAP